MMSTSTYSTFGHVLNYMDDCAQDYTTYQGTDYDVMNGTMNLYAIHPVTVLGALSNNFMMMESQCQIDVEGHAFSTCAPTAYARCNSSFTNPGYTANSTYWSDEFVPIKTGMDCILDAAFNMTGFGQDQEFACFSWLKKTPVYMCYNDITSSMCSGDLSGQINCLVDNIQGGMVEGDCRTALSNYPSNFMSLTGSALLQYEEAFYGLVANPVGDPFATPSPGPTVAPTAAPTMAGDEGMRRRRDMRGDPAAPLIVLLVVLVAVVVGVGVFFWYRKGKANGKELNCCKKTQGHTFDEAAADANGPPATTNAQEKMEQVEIR